jgi:site-specific DNA recombinase
LLADAAAGHFDTVSLYRLDRLGRSIRVLLDADAELERAGVTLCSTTEPFDTSTPIGRFVFQSLGSIAELERSTITERMTMGRGRVARDGRWTNGPIPFGYDLDGNGCLIPSSRVVPGVERTEAEIAREVFERVAAGSSTVAEARRLNTLGAPTHRRYGGGAVVTVGEMWQPSRINAMLKNSVYRGEHTFKSKRGPITREVPPLVTPELWMRVQEQLVSNCVLSTRNARHQYLLRGLIRCSDCGRNYAGTSVHGRGRVGYYYRCNSQLGALSPHPEARCPAKRLPSAWLEDEV